MTAWARCVPSGARLLDLPAGTGRFIELWRSRRAHVHAVDISEDMLAELRRRWPAGDTLTIERADAEALPYAARSFDFVVCWRLLHLLPPEAAERVLREFARVCCGQIVLEVFNVISDGRVRVAARAVKRKMRQWLGRSAQAHPAIPDTAWAHITSYPQTEFGLQALFSRCGLKVKRAETLTMYQGTPTRVYHLETGGAR